MSEQTLRAVRRVLAASVTRVRRDRDEIVGPYLDADHLYSVRLIALPLISDGHSREQIAVELERQLGPDGVSDALDYVLGRGSTPTPKSDQIDSLAIARAWVRLF